jgi:hypothetical protein
MLKSVWCPVLILCSATADFSLMCTIFPVNVERYTSTRLEGPLHFRAMKMQVFNFQASQSRRT